MDNIKKLRQMIDKMEQIEQDLTFFFENIPVLFVIANKTGNLCRVNAEWTKYLGWSEEELISQPWLNFVHPEDIPKTLEAAKVLDTEILNGFVNRYRTKYGTYKALKWYISPWVNGRNYGVALQMD